MISFRSDQWAVVTGASGGIGFEFCRQLETLGLSLVMISRSSPRLKAARKKLSSSRHLLFQADLSLPASVNKLQNFLKGRKIKPAVWINNAGSGQLGYFISAPVNVHEKLLQLNLNSLVSLSHYFLSTAEKRKEKSYLLNVGSIAGYLPGPGMNTYYAGKAAVNSFTLALREENKNPHIHIHLLSPGPVKTLFQKESGGKEDYPMLRLAGVSAAEAVRQGLKGLWSGKAETVPGLINRIILVFQKFLPRSILIKQSANVQNQKKKSI